MTTIQPHDDRSIQIQQAVNYPEEAAAILARIEQYINEVWRAPEQGEVALDFAHNALANAETLAGMVRFLAAIIGSLATDLHLSEHQRNAAVRQLSRIQAAARSGDLPSIEFREWTETDEYGDTIVRNEIITSYDEDIDEAAADGYSAAHDQLPDVVADALDVDYYTAARLIALITEPEESTDWFRAQLAELLQFFDEQHPGDES